MLYGERYPRYDEAERADGEGHQISHKDAACGGYCRDPPEDEEHAGFAGARIGGHERAEREPSERQEQQQSPEQDHYSCQQKAHLAILPNDTRVSQPFPPRPAP